MINPRGEACHTVGGLSIRQEYDEDHREDYSQAHCIRSMRGVWSTTLSLPLAAMNVLHFDSDHDFFKNLLSKW